LGGRASRRAVCEAKRWLSGSFALPCESTMRARNLAGPVVVFAVALAIRLVYLWQSRSSPLFEYPNLDAEFHVTWAKAIAAGETLFPGPYFRAPLYPAMLGLLYWLAGPGFLLPRVIQCVMGSASCVLVYLIGREAFGRAVGWIAGLAAATYWIFVYFDGELLLEPLSVFLNLAAVWMMLRAGRGAQQELRPPVREAGSCENPFSHALSGESVPRNAGWESHGRGAEKGFSAQHSSAGASPSLLVRESLLARIRRGIRSPERGIESRGRGAEKAFSAQHHG